MLTVLIASLGPLVRKVPPQIIGPMMEKLSTLKLKNSVDNAVPALAIRTVIEALPRPTASVIPGRDVQEAYANVSRVLIPRLLGRSVSNNVVSKGSVRLPAPSEGLLENDQDLNADAIDVLIEVVRCYGPMLQPVEVEALQDAVVTLLEKDRGTSVVKKRAVVALSLLANYISDNLLAVFIARASATLQGQNTTPVTRRLYISILGSMARSIPQRFGQHMPSVAPLILAALSEEELAQQMDEIGDGSDATELNEVREAALVALEAFFASCPTQMRPYTEDALAACLRYLKYDPNYAVDEDEDMEEEAEEDDDFGDDDDEFEADAGFDDDDDTSWKVRRTAAKAIYTLIATRSSGDLLEKGVLYEQAAPALVKRFDEREENVRLEVISALSLLVRKTGEGIIPEFSLDAAGQSDSVTKPPGSRKRRRQSSGAGAAAFALSTTQSDLSGSGLVSPILERIPSHGPRADLAQLTPSIIKGTTKLLKGKSVPTKQAALNLIGDIVTVQGGGLSEYFDQVVGLIIDAIVQSSAASTSTSLAGAGGNASATPTTVRIAALRLMSDIAKTHSSSVLAPHLTKIVAGVLSVVHDRFYKISSEAVQTLEELINAITPPRSQSTAEKYKKELEKIDDTLSERARATDADAEVRQKAIQALGALLARTSSEAGFKLITAERRQAGLNLLYNSLMNETTRLAAVRAIDNVALRATKGTFSDKALTGSIITELVQHLRKANRGLRGSSIQALKHMTLSPATRGILSPASIRTVVDHLVPVINNNDAHTLGPALTILANLVQDAPKEVTKEPVITAICETLRTNVAGNVLDSMLLLVTNIGQAGGGKVLMGALLQNVGVNGDPAVVGKVIGTLLVASGSSSGVTVESFVDELKTNSSDPTRVSLALAVLGEAALRLGPKSPLKPDIFLQQFSSEYDKVSLSAAVALGRAGAGNVQEYLPVILSGLKQAGNTQYLLLQSVKEILQQVVASSTDISDYSTNIWDQVLEAASVEDNKAVCAECIGRLTLIKPKTYLPKLDLLLRNNSPALRAVAVQALRYTLPESDDAFDAVLRNYLVEMLKTMLEDPEMDIRRHAMSTLNAAAHNKPDLIMAHLSQLVPYVMRESVIRKELVREVMMGPFKHTVDDGLEVRKASQPFSLPLCVSSD
jgi:cullin-associated NEDD8-dissociated protein 1